MNTIETILVMVWLFGSGVILYIVIKEQRRLEKKDNCQHKETFEHIGKRKTIKKCLDCKCKLKH